MEPEPVAEEGEEAEPTEPAQKGGRGKGKKRRSRARPEVNSDVRYLDAGNCKSLAAQHWPAASFVLLLGVYSLGTAHKMQHRPLRKNAG